MDVAIEQEPTSTRSSGPAKKQRVQPVAAAGDRSGGVSTVAMLWKPAKFLIVFGLIGTGVYFFRGALRFDPGPQAMNAQDQVQPGMDVDQVVKAIGKTPREVWTIQDPPPGSDPLALAKDVRIPYRDNFLKHYGPDKIGNGFRFVYRYSERNQLHIYFSPNGIVEDSEIIDPMKALGM
jgi:hypothetical protein